MVEMLGIVGLLYARKAIRPLGIPRGKPQCRSLLYLHTCADVGVDMNNDM